MGSVPISCFLSPPDNIDLSMNTMLFGGKINATKKRFCLIFKCFPNIQLFGHGFGHLYVMASG